MHCVLRMPEVESLFQTEHAPAAFPKGFTDVSTAENLSVTAVLASLLCWCMGGDPKTVLCSVVGRQKRWPCFADTLSAFSFSTRV